MRKAFASILPLFLLLLFLPGLAIACIQCTTTWEQGIALSAEIDKPESGARFCPGSYIDYGIKNLVGDDLRITDCQGTITTEHISECETIVWSVNGGELVPRTPWDPPRWHLPCAPGNYTITVNIADHQCQNADGWYDDDDVELSRTIEVVGPVHEPTWMIPPPSPVGGAFKGVIKTETMCAELGTDWSLDIRKTGSSDPWMPILLAPYCYRPAPIGCCQYPEEEPNITDCQYLVAGWTVPYPCTLDPDPSTPVNGGYETRLKFTYTPCNGCGDPQDQYLTGQLNVKNLFVQHVTPEDHVRWDGENVSGPITVALDDNDLTDPMDITVEIYSCAEGEWVHLMGDEWAWSWSPVRTMQQFGVTGGSHEFIWDGKDDYDDPVDPGVYTFEVTVDQHHEELGEDLPEHLRSDPYVLAALSYDDCTSYRSRFLRAERANDEYGNPVFEAEYYGYDDNGTPEDDSDDSILYLLRSYILRDWEDTDADSGTLKMYDPDMVKQAEWNVSSLYCIDHDDYDGLHASSLGEYHSVIVPVQKSLIKSDQPYRFVLHFMDDHADKYRDNQKRPALDINEAYVVKPVIVVSASSRQYVPTIGTTTNVTIRLVDSNQPSKPTLTEAAAPITVKVTPSRLPSTCTNYKAGSDAGEEYADHTPKVDFTWTKVGTSDVDDDRDHYSSGDLTKIIYSTKSKSIPAGALTYSGGTLTMTLKSYDYGGRIKIEPSGSNSSGAFAVESANDPLRSTNRKRAYLYVPEDFDEDRLVDSWESSQPSALGFTIVPANPGDDYDIGQNNDFAKDNDPSPDPPTEAGDHYRAFEEYRGVMHKGAHSRLDPGTKDLLVSTQLDTGNIQAASGYQITEVDPATELEMSHDNLTTWNTQVAATTDYGGQKWGQKGIRVRDVPGINPVDPDYPEGVPIDKLGRSRCGVPASADYEHCVRIFTGHISWWVDHPPPQWDGAALRRHVITHEMGHDLNQVGHAGDGTTCVMHEQSSINNYTMNTFCSPCKNGLELQ